MPKLLTYRRPASVSKANWNGAPNKQTPPRPAPAQPAPAGRIDLPALTQIIRKE